MRWERLFDDLEARFEAEEHAVAAGELADLTRAELAGITLAARLEAQLGGLLGWWLGPAGSGVGGAGDVGGIGGDGDAGRIDAVLLEIGSDWVLLRHGRRELLVPLRMVCGISGLARMARPGEGSVARRLSMGTVLRRLARDRVEVSLRLAGGQQSAGGTIDRVGADHLDLAEHATGEFRRQAAVLQVRTVPWGALVWVSVPTGPELSP